MHRRGGHHPSSSTQRGHIKRAALVVGALALGLVAVGPSPNANPQIEGLCAVADGMVAEGQLKAAEDLYNKLLDGANSDPCVADGLAAVAAARQEQAARLCAVADGMVAEGQLKAAEDLYNKLLDGANSNLCVLGGLANVAGRRQRAMDAVRDGNEALRTGDLDAAKDEFGEARSLDADSADAITGLDQVEERQVSATARAAARWDRLYANWAEPATRLLLPFLAVLIFLLVQARLARLLFPVDWKAWGDWPRRIAWIMGLVLAALGAGVLTVFAAAPDRTDLGSMSASRLFWGGLLSAFGILFLALAAAMRLRLQIEAHSADGKTDAAATDYVVARLNGLGSARPQGLEVPQQTDVTNLPEEALTTLPEGVVAKAVFRVMRAALPAVPWRATVSIVDDDRVAVTLTRNRRPGDAVVISRHSLGLPGIPAEGKGKERDDAITRGRAQLLTAAASFIFVALSRRHPRLQEGLCGATHWSGVALHVLATEKPLADDEIAHALLAIAVDTDPANALARVAYLHHLGRHANDRAGQQRFAEAADTDYAATFPDQEAKKGYEALEMRILFSRAAAWLNVHLLQSDVGAWSQAVEAARSLVYRLDKKHDPSELMRFVEDMRPAAAYLWKGVHDRRPSGQDPEDLSQIVDKWIDTETLSLRARYDRACWNAESDNGNKEKALDELELVVGLEDYRTWARRDPSLKSLREDASNDQKKRFKELVGDPVPGRFMALPSLTEHAQRLAAVGIHSPEQLLARTATVWQRQELARYLDVAPIVVGRWQSVVLLTDLHPDLRKASLLDLLLAVGIDSPEGLVDAAANSDQLVERLAEAAVDRAVVPPTPAEVRAWIPPN